MSQLPAGTASAEPGQQQAISAFDETDQRIIALLRRDGRMSFRHIAQQLQMPEATVRARVRRLEDSDSMRVVAVTDIEAAGYSMLLAVGIELEGRSATAVATDLAAIDEVFSVSVVIGTHDIEILTVARDQDQLDELLGRLAVVGGVRRLLPSLAVNVLKNQPHWVPFSHAPRGSLHADDAARGGGEGQLDRVDRKIVARLAVDARTSNRRIAADLGVTEGTVRGRIKRLEDGGLIRITAVSNIERLHNPMLAFIWVDMEKSAGADELARQLAAVPRLGFVGKMLGRFDILAITMVQNPEELSDFVQTEISGIPGVHRTDVTLGVKFIKHDYRISRIVD